MAIEVPIRNITMAVVSADFKRIVLRSAMLISR